MNLSTEELHNALRLLENKYLVFKELDVDIKQQVIDSILSELPKVKELNADKTDITIAIFNITIDICEELIVADECYHLYVCGDIMEDEYDEYNRLYPGFEYLAHVEVGNYMYISYEQLVEKVKQILNKSII